MSPVSRGRKKKPQVKRSPRDNPASRSRFAEQRFENAREALHRELAATPGWFNPATSSVLSSADDLLGLDGPRDVEDAVVRLLAVQMADALESADAATPFERWFAFLVERAGMEFAEGLADDAGTAWRGPLRLLYGLTSISWGEHRSGAEDTLAAAQLDLRAAGVGQDEPRWLRAAPRLRSSGEIHQVADRFGGRHGVFAVMDDRSGRTAVYAWDVDVCFMPVVAGGGWFDDLDAATRWWRTQAGAAAVGPDGDLDPRPTRDVAPLRELDFMLHGDETGTALEEFFRARRRVEDLDRTASLDAGRFVPDVAARAEEFEAWLRERDAGDVDPEVLDYFVHEATRGDVTPSGVASAHRAFFLRDTITTEVDPDHAVSGVMTALLPLWFRFLGEGLALTGDELARPIDVAGGAPLEDDDCLGVFAR